MERAPTFPSRVGGLIALSNVFWLIERWAGMVNRASLYLADAV
jgi:hypothetical protein